MGFWNKQHDYMDDFQTKNWEHLSEKERLNRLQSLEKSMAKEQGRKPRKIEPCQGNYCGSYDWGNSDKLYINQSYLDAKTPGEQYDAMNTVIHEGRHAYQHDCIEGKIRNPLESQETISIWSKNRPDEIYNKPKDDFSRYRFQPIEADANDYADDKMSSYKNKFDKDPNYEKYMYSINDAKQADVDRAAERLEAKPNEKEIKEKISNEINEKYAWNHRYIPTQEEQDQAFSKLCEYGKQHYGEDWQQMRGELICKDPEFRNLHQIAFPDYQLPPMNNTTSNISNFRTVSDKNDLSASDVTYTTELTSCEDSGAQTSFLSKISYSDSSKSTNEILSNRDIDLQADLGLQGINSIDNNASTLTASNSGGIV